MVYELTNGSLTARVDSLGAQLLSLTDGEGFEHIWTGDPAYWSSRAPVLFPIVGALRNGKAKIGGKWYAMGQHGFARKMEFCPVDQRAGSIALELRSNAESRQSYPFDFSLTVTVALTGEGFTTAFAVENRGEGDMPFAIGGHPGFNIPVEKGAAFEDYTLVFEKPENQRCPAIDTSQALIDPAATAYRLEGREIPLRHSLFYQDALIFENLQSRTVQIVNKASGRGLEMDFTGFPLLGVWSAKNDGPYVCLEPWVGCATRTDEGDDFEEKHGLCVLSPGETFSRSFAVRFF